MAKYKCNVCGYVFDEEEQGIPFSELKECPVCHQPASAFSIYEEIQQVKREEKKTESLEYPREFVREDESCRYMKEIHEMAVTGKSIHAAMGTRLPMPSWDEILILGDNDSLDRVTADLALISEIPDLPVVQVQEGHRNAEFRRIQHSLDRIRDRIQRRPLFQQGVQEEIRNDALRIQEDAGKGRYFFKKSSRFGEKQSMSTPSSRQRHP